MRKLLSDLASKRTKRGTPTIYSFRGTVDHIGFTTFNDFYSKKRIKPLIFFKNISINKHKTSKVLCSNYSNQFLRLGELQKGDRLSFSGQLQRNKNTQTGFKIAYPNNPKLTIHKSKFRLEMPLNDDNPNELIGYICIKCNILSNHFQKDILKYKEWKDRNLFLYHWRHSAHGKRMIKHKKQAAKEKETRIQELVHLDINAASKYFKALSKILNLRNYKIYRNLSILQTELLVIYNIWIKLKNGMHYTKDNTFISVKLGHILSFDRNQVYKYINSKKADSIEYPFITSPLSTFRSLKDCLEHIYYQCGLKWVPSNKALETNILYKIVNHHIRMMDTKTNISARYSRNPYEAVFFNVSHGSISNAIRRYTIQATKKNRCKQTRKRIPKRSKYMLITHGKMIINKVRLRHFKKHGNNYLFDCRCMNYLLKAKKQRKRIKKQLKKWHIKHVFSALKLMSRIYRYYINPNKHNTCSVIGSFGVMHNNSLVPSNSSYASNVNNYTQTRAIAKLAEECLINTEKKKRHRQTRATVPDDFTRIFFGK